MQCHSPGLRLSWQKIRSSLRHAMQTGSFFIGPRAQVMRIMGNKIESRAFVKKSGSAGNGRSDREPGDLIEAKARSGFPFC